MDICCCEIIDNLKKTASGQYIHMSLDIQNFERKIFNIFLPISFNKSSLQCYSVLSDILVKNELCIPLERGSNVLSTGEGFICLSPPSKLKIAVLFCSIYKKRISFSAIVF